MKLNYFKTYENYEDSIYFYLVIYDYRKIIYNDMFINDNKIKGLIGISESEYIDNAILHEIKFKMNKKDTLILNPNLEKINYNNIDSFIKNNFKLYKRVDNNIHHIVDLYKSLAAYITGNNSDEKYLKSIFKQIETNENGKKISDYELPEFNTVKDFSKFICNLDFEYFQEDAIDDVYQILKKCFKNFTTSYEHEEEWLVNSEYFNIPKTSKIEILLKNIIKIHNIDTDEIQKIKNISSKLGMFTIII